MNVPRLRVQPVYIALAAVAVVAVVVGVQMVNARTDTRATSAASPAVSSSAAPDNSASSDSPPGAAAKTPAPAGQSTPGTAPADDGDGADDAPASAAPAPADVTAARNAATAFTAAWLNTTNKSIGQWRAELAKHVTPALANDLAAADPETVPVGQIGSPITVTVGADRLAHVTIPITTGGAVTVTVVLDGHPLVSDVDWVKP